MGIFDKLQKDIDKVQQDTGISTMDLANLPPVQRRIMRILLRELQMTYPDLRDRVAELPEKDRFSVPELDEALDTLSKQQWLIRLGEDQLITYKVNLKRKAGSALAAGLWSNLNAKIKTAADAARAAEDQSAASDSSSAE
jgi:hypothetical protein